MSLHQSRFGKSPIPDIGIAIIIPKILKQFMQSILMELDNFSEMMRCLFLGSSSNQLDRSQYYPKAINILSGKINIHQNNEQLFRELYCGRFYHQDVLEIYQILVEKYNYQMTSKDLKKLKGTIML